jgi:cellobiose dehydrogenase (acceptor)
MGTCKMGTDDGRLPNGTSVVDTNTKIYGTDNMFVVDASIWPGMPSTNPSALIVTAAEHASDLILALPPPKKVGLVKNYGQCSTRAHTVNGLTCDGGLTCKAVNYFYSIIRRLYDAWHHAELKTCLTPSPLSSLPISISLPASETIADF